MIEITVEERARTFDVFVGSKLVGRVIAHTEPEDDKDSESYRAQRRVGAGVGTEEFENVGWHVTLKLASLAIIDHQYGVLKIDKITKRKA